MCLGVHYRYIFRCGDVACIHVVSDDGLGSGDTSSRRSWSESSGMGQACLLRGHWSTATGQLPHEGTGMPRLLQRNETIRHYMSKLNV